MKTKNLNIWFRISSSFWFIPSVLVIMAIMLSFATIRLDEFFLARDIHVIRVLFKGGVSGARAVLSTIATSMITVAGVVFSITMVVLSLASSQFGSRLIWNFMNDKGNQVVLGTFIATFMYCILSLRSISDSDGGVSVPHLSVTIGMILSLASLGLLIYFIHHVSSSLHANNVIASVGTKLYHAIDRLFPVEVKKEQPNETDENKKKHGAPEDFEARAQIVCSKKSGYLQAISKESLLKTAHDNNLLLRIEHHPGRFITEGYVLLRAYPREYLSNDIINDLQSAFIIGNLRTIEQDVEFGFNELSEIALRALSKGINDSFTALTCVDWMGAGLAELARRSFPSSLIYDGENNLRVIFKHYTFRTITEAAFNMIRQSARDNISVSIRLLEKIEIVGRFVRHEEDRTLLAQQARIIWGGIDSILKNDLDKKALEECYRAALQTLGKKRDDL